jgi:hypothetical protein
MKTGGPAQPGLYLFKGDNLELVDSRGEKG